MNNRARAIATIAVMILLIGGLVSYFASQVGTSSATRQSAVENLLKTRSDPTFRSDQLENSNVHLAFMEREPALKAMFAEKGMPWPPAQMLVRVIADEAVAEVFVPGKEGKLEMLRAYPLCLEPRKSLNPGGRADPAPAAGTEAAKAPATRKAPSLPWGFYTIERFFPQDLNSFLALKISHPNEADRKSMKKGEKPRELLLKGGCGPDSLSITTDGIKDVYWLAVEARTAGQKEIPVHIFPRRLTGEGLEAAKQAAGKDRKLVARLDNLKEGWDWVETRRQLPAVSIDPEGRYLFQEPASVAEAAAGTAPGAVPAEKIPGAATSGGAPGATTSGAP